MEIAPIGTKCPLCGEYTHLLRNVTQLTPGVDTLSCDVCMQICYEGLASVNKWREVNQISEEDKRVSREYTEEFGDSNEGLSLDEQRQLLNVTTVLHQALNKTVQLLQSRNLAQEVPALVAGVNNAEIAIDIYEQKIAQAERARVSSP